MLIFHTHKLKKSLFFLILMIIILLSTFLLSKLINCILKPDSIPTLSATPRASFSTISKVVIDAGHGEPDGGAVSHDGIKESTLNLQIALKLEDALLSEGIDVVMTREDEDNIASPEKQSSLREMKVSDIDNRIAITNQSNADALISIHMNQFSASKYHGWQTFYQKGSAESKLLAENIQNEITKSIGTENSRTALKIENIKLIDNAKIPAVIVECGFLSNEEEKRLLQEEEYQEKIVRGIVNGVLLGC